MDELELDALPWRVGHWTHESGRTGCTVVLCEAGGWAAGEVRGAAPGTRETDLLRPGGLVGQVHAVLLGGGSAVGLAAADGVVRWLQARGAGYRVGPGVPPVPIVPGAVIFDAGAATGVYPDAAAGAAACAAALTAAGPQAGRVGAGAGASVGKLGGADRASPGGVGSAVLRAAGVLAGAVMVVNAVGEVRDPASGQIVAGIRGPDGDFIPTLDMLAAQAAVQSAVPNTTIGVVATNVPLPPAALDIVARMANSGLARAITPAHTMFDGDTIVALSLPGPGGPAPPEAPPARPDPGLITLVGALAAEAVIRAILRAVR